MSDLTFIHQSTGEQLIIKDGWPLVISEGGLKTYFTKHGIDNYNLWFEEKAFEEGFFSINPLVKTFSWFKEVSTEVKQDQINKIIANHQ